MNFPEKCPYCGKDTRENVKIHQYDPVNQIIKYGVELHTCLFCNNPIFVLKEEYWCEDKIETSKILKYFPPNTSVEYPERTMLLSLKAYEIYKQTLQAKEHGFDLLLGAGMRMAFEQLILDYLVKIKEKSIAELSKMQPAARIKLMDAEYYEKVRMRYLTLYGNDSIHAIQKNNFTPDEINTAMETYQLLCEQIDHELQGIWLAERIKDMK